MQHYYGNHAEATVTSWFGFIWYPLMLLLAWYLYNRLSPDVPTALAATCALTFSFMVLSPWQLPWYSAVAWVTLTQTPFGRQIYAVGADPDAAAKAGIRIQAIVFSVFCICGACAAVGALISVSQVGGASATFGYQEEFPVIAAAVLGGTSLFGGRGGVIGSIFGAVLVQTTSNGLVMLNANPYLYPLVNSVIIFVAAWVDGRRRILTERLEQRKIRVEA